MDCAVEEAEIRHVLGAVAGIRGLSFQLGARVLAIDADEAVVERSVVELRKAGFEPQALPVADAGAGDGEGATREGIARLVLALVLAAAAETIGFFAPAAPLWTGVGLAVAVAAIVLSGLSVYRKGLAALRRGRLNINALMTVAVTGAFLIGQWPEAAMVMALYATAEAIEARAVDRARRAITRLLELAPQRATARQADGRWADTPLADVAIGAVVRVRPGERVPLDGVVTSGNTTIDQSSVTGESIPVDKTVGDVVYAGTINATGGFEFEATSTASNSTLARIIHAVEQAQATRAPMQGLVDRFAAVYTPAVFVIALAVTIGGPWLAGWTWLQAIYKALVLLVIACPCALVISTPVTIVSGLAAAARRGILIKGGVHLENARRLKVVALDKTGTVTEGKPRLVTWAVMDGVDAAAAARIAAALAARSDHPVSKAIVAGIDAGRGTKGGAVSDPGVTDFGALAGRGIHASIGGTPHVLGSRRLIGERGLLSAAAEALAIGHEQAGRAVTMLASTERVLAVFAVADTIRPSSREAVTALRTLGITPVMLSGDNQATAEAIAREAGIGRQPGEVRGNLLPDDKLAALEDLQRRQGATAMVGDGINDAPALARSDLGFAMGGAGTDAAMEAADVVVTTDDLRRVAETVRLSKATHAVLWQNIVLALGIKAVFLVLAVVGDASMWMAVFADMGASLLVVANGLRLLRRGAAATPMP